MDCHYPNCDGGPATGYCHAECREPPQQWFVCDECNGSGVYAYRITVYEPGCGFPHDDTAEKPCPECNGAGGRLDDAEHHRTFD